MIDFVGWDRRRARGVYKRQGGDATTISIADRFRDSSSTQSLLSWRQWPRYIAGAEQLRLRRRRLRLRNRQSARQNPARPLLVQSQSYSPLWLFAGSGNRVRQRRSLRAPGYLRPDR